MSTISELAVLAQTDPAYYEPLWLAVKGRVTYWAYKYRGNRETRLFDTDDLIQAGFIALVCAVRDYNTERDGFLTLFRFYVRRSFAEVSGTRGTRLRAEKYAVSLDEPKNEDFDEPLVNSLPDPRAEFEDVVIEQESHRQNLAALQPVFDALPEAQRLALILTARDCLPHKTVADTIGVPVDRVRTLRELAQRKVRNSEQGRRIAEEYNAYRHVSLSQYRRTGISEPERFLLWLEEIEKNYGGNHD